MTMMLAQASLGGGARLSLADIPDPVSAFVFGSDATCTLTLEADGDIVQDSVDIGDWVAPKSAAGAAYEARMVVNSGTVTSGTTGSWLGLGSNRTWTQAQIGSPGLQTANVTLEIGLAGTSTAIASKTFDFSAEYGS